MKPLLLFALLASSADASVFAYRQSASQSGNTALAFPSNNIANNMIVVATSASFVSAMHDTQNNSYVQIVNFGFGNDQISIWASFSIKAGANSVTPTGLAASGAHSSIAIVEYTVPSSYVFSAGVSYTGTPINGSGGSYQSAGETLLVIASYDYHASHSWTGTNLTVRETVAEAGGQTMSLGDVDLASSTTSTVSTLNGCSSTNDCTSAVLVNFANAGGGATPSASAFVGLQ